MNIHNKYLGVGSLSLWRNKLNIPWIQRSLIAVVIGLPIILMLGCFSSTANAGTVTLTTYYPAPSGEYVDLQTDRLAVGDTNNDGAQTVADLPNISGNIRLKPQSGNPTGWSAGATSCAPPAFPAVSYVVIVWAHQLSSIYADEFRIWMGSIRKDLGNFKPLTIAKCHGILPIEREVPMVAVLDKFGRIVIPQKFRHELGLHSGDKLEIREEGGHLVLVHTPDEPLLRGRGKALIYAGRSTGDIEGAIKELRLERFQHASGWNV